ncbi:MULTISPECIES: hypothetical protein [unclassified Bradyrhizobium]|uniref:hypothetical protein n=1 Tax=unclassified Bradyrhizobium TaxID=2631580 RepID=UPI001FF7673E|nr:MULTISPECIES: hypothetical protein [unclassified Bradyrhizobium]MCK1296678.1 hypothetical protein [Bradyrhizobium sp. 37]MCK1770436.1 hypothetical protein [Bradyrhizobium sp. 134]
MLTEIAPADHEIVLPKNPLGCIQYDHPKQGIEVVIVAGVLTNQRIDMASRDGSDCGFFMICASAHARPYGKLNTKTRYAGSIGPYESQQQQISSWN